LVALNKLRIDLFDRRYRVFDAARKFIAHIHSHAAVDGSQLFEFSAATLDAEFLFDADVVSFLDEMKKHALSLRLVQKRLESLPVGDERTRQAQIENDAIAWFDEQFTPVKHMFTPYLGFANVRLTAIPPFKFWYNALRSRISRR
jgi:hypothetical protein